jgi:hypothetical protein
MMLGVIVPAMIMPPVIVTSTIFAMIMSNLFAARLVRLMLMIMLMLHGILFLTTKALQG